MEPIILTHERIAALSRINRYNGWVNRDYSVLEHSVIGALTLREMGESRMVQRAFLLHDLEETEFTDMIRPHKQKYMNDKYTKDVRAWVRNLSIETGVPVHVIEGWAVARMDDMMCMCEMPVVYTGDRRHTPYIKSQQAEIASDMIKSAVYMGGVAREQFWKMWYA